MLNNFSKFKIFPLKKPDNLFSYCLRLIFFSVFFTMAASCSRRQSDNGLLIAVSIPPQEWFVSQIAKDNAKVMVLASPGQNPHNYEASPKQIQSLVSANAWVLSGCEFEIGLLPKITALFPNLPIIDGTEGVKFRLLDEDDHEGEDNNYDDDKHFAGNNSFSSILYDRHTWLGREPAIILAEHIRDTLSFIDVENKEFYFDNTQKLIQTINDEFDILKIELAPLYGKTIFVYHPSFGYFLDEFGIKQTAVEAGGKEPFPRALNDMVFKLREEHASAIFIQSQFPVSAAKTLAMIEGLDLIELDPLAENWLENIKQIGNSIKMSFADKSELKIYMDNK